MLNQILSYSKISKSTNEHEIVMRRTILQLGMQYNAILTVPINSSLSFINQNYGQSSFIQCHVGASLAASRIRVMAVIY